MPVFGEVCGERPRRQPRIHREFDGRTREEVARLGKQGLFRSSPIELYATRGKPLRPASSVAFEKVTSSLSRIRGIDPVDDLVAVDGFHPRFDETVVIGIVIIIVIIETSLEQVVEHPQRYDDSSQDIGEVFEYDPIDLLTDRVWAIFSWWLVGLRFPVLWLQAMRAGCF